MGSKDLVEREGEEAVGSDAEKMGSIEVIEARESTKPVEGEEAIPALTDPMESIEIKVDDEDEDEDDGPPPGWQPIVRSSPPPTDRMGSKEIEEEEEEEEKKAQILGEQVRIRSEEIEGVEAIPAHTDAMENKEIIEGRGGEEEDDDDGPPPGWQPIVTSPPAPAPAPSPSLLPSTGKMGSKELKKEEEEVKADISGDTVRTRSQEIKGEEAIPAHTEGVENKEIKGEEDDGPPPGWQPIVPSSPVPSPLLLPNGEEDDNGPPPGWQPMIPSSPVPSPSLPPIEMTQMVCGSCRQLLSYPRGARHVKCSSCQTVNFVLEEHQVGQVTCGSCSILLMYPYGAPSVRCSCCRYVTEIGEHNKRPPWSTQQGRPFPTPHPVQ